MEREEVLKDYICMKYKSVRQFTLDKNLKYSTIAGLLSHSLGKANIDTVFEICRALNISADALIERGIIVEKAPANPKIDSTYRRIEAYRLIFATFANLKDFTLDGVMLNEEEIKIFRAGIDALIELIRNYRKDNKESQE